MSTSKPPSSADTAGAPAASQRSSTAPSGRPHSRPPAKSDGPVGRQSRGTSKRPSPYSDLGREAPTSAQRRAAAVLEVLAGQQTVAEAARALESENQTLRQQLTAAEVRRELAEVLPQVVHTPQEAGKKGASAPPPPPARHPR